MKKQLLNTWISLFFLAIPFAGMSQLKVLSTGNVRIGAASTYNTSNYATLNLYGNNTCTISSYAEFSLPECDAIKSVVNRGDAAAFAAWYGGSRTFMIYGNGNVWSWGTGIYASDERLKESILPIESAKSRLLKLNGKSYNFKKQDDKKRRHMGLLAQDVEAIFPEIVYETDSGVKGIAYVELIPVIIEALKEQSAEMDELRKEIAQLKSTKTQKTVTVESSASSSNTFDLSTLAQNVPNPFSETTRIDIYLSTSVSKAMFYVYNLQGAQVKALAINQRGNTNVVI